MHALLHIYAGGQVGLESWNNFAGVEVSLRRSLRNVSEVGVRYRKVCFELGVRG
jgi:hypothetical protein